MMPCFARFLFIFCNRTKICQKNRNLGKLAKHDITTLYQKSHKIYPTLNKCMQPELWMVKCIDRATRPLSNDGGNELCAADGLIDEGWEHITGTLSKLSG